MSAVSESVTLDFFDVGHNQNINLSTRIDNALEKEVQAFVSSNLSNNFQFDNLTRFLLEKSEKQCSELFKKSIEELHLDSHHAKNFIKANLECLKESINVPHFQVIAKKIMTVFETCVIVASKENQKLVQTGIQNEESCPLALKQGSQEYYQDLILELNSRMNLMEQNHAKAIEENKKIIKSTSELVEKQSQEIRDLNKQLKESHLENEKLINENKQLKEKIASMGSDSVLFSFPDKTESSKNKLSNVKSSTVLSPSDSNCFPASKKQGGSPERGSKTSVAQDEFSGSTTSFPLGHFEGILSEGSTSKVKKVVDRVEKMPTAQKVALAVVTAGATIGCVYAGIQLYNYSKLKNL